MAPLNRPKSLTELVTENLRCRIVAGDFELGSQLSEARIAKDLQVSRTPVREAINRLEIEGLLVVEPQRGSFVFNLKAVELAKLCDARLCLETAALTHAIAANPTLLHKALSSCLGQMTRALKAGRHSDYLTQDRQFHQYLFDHADNRFLNEAYQKIALKMAALRNRLDHKPEHLEESHSEHVALAAAVKDRDVPLALEILRSHLDPRSSSYWIDAARQIADV